MYNIIFITKITRTPIYKRQFGTPLFNVKVWDEWFKSHITSHFQKIIYSPPNYKLTEYYSFQNFMWLSMSQIQENITSPLIIFFLFGFLGQGLTMYLWLFWPWIYRNLPASAIWVFGLKVYTSTPNYENILKKIHMWWRVSGSEKFRQVQRPRILKASVLGPRDTGMSKTSTLLWLQEVPALVTLLWYSVWYSSWHGVSIWGHLGWLNQDPEAATVSMP